MQAVRFPNWIQPCCSQNSDHLSSQPAYSTEGEMRIKRNIKVNVLSSPVLEDTDKMLL